MSATTDLASKLEQRLLKAVDLFKLFLRSLLGLFECCKIS